MIELIKENISWVKDIIIIIFTISATIITILTYFRAKSTILQPVRTEVIKTQVAKVIEMMNFIEKYNYSPKSLYDYYDLVSINTEIFLNELGFVNIDANRKNELNEKIDGWIVFTKNYHKSFVYVKGSYEEYLETLPHFKKVSTHELSKLKLEKLNVIFYTKTYMESYKMMSKYADDPILPLKMIKLLMKIKYDGKINLLHNLEESVIFHLKKYINLTLNKRLNNTTLGELNRESHKMFDDKRFKHDDDIIKLKAMIRIHLRIDEKWV